MSSLARCFFDKDPKITRAGRQAYRDGFSEIDCPHPIGSGDKRVAWFDGFLEEQIHARVGHILAKYNIPWP